MKFPNQFKIKTDQATACYTGIKIGGTADFLTEVFCQEELIDLQKYCRENNLRLLVLGAGTNVFFSDDGFRGVVAILKFDEVTLRDRHIIRAEAGAPLATVQKLCAEKSLAGFEFAAGIPGTVGGAIYGNAGAYGKNVGECLTRAKVLTVHGELKWVRAEFFDFSYRNSALKKNPAILLEAEFDLIPGEPEQIRQKVAGILELRRQKLPPDDWATAGSWFKNLKNPDGTPLPAAKLLEAIGSKQISEGGMAVFQNHANIFYNKGSATAQDVLRLETILKQRVQEKFGIELEREVIFIE